MLGIKEAFKYILVAHGKASAGELKPTPAYMTRWPHGKYGGGMAWIYDTHAVMLYQGTAGTIEDWKRNFNFLPCEIGQYCGVHRGFVEEYAMFDCETHRAVERALLGSVREIIFTGYSQGGATAALAAIDCAEKYCRPMTCITFGSPQYLNEHGRHKFNSAQVDYRNVVNPLDVVTKVPPGAYRAGVDYRLPVEWWKYLIPSRFIVGIVEHTLEAYSRQINKE